MFVNLPIRGVGFRGDVPACIHGRRPWLGAASHFVRRSVFEFLDTLVVRVGDIDVAAPIRRRQQEAERPSPPLPPPGDEGYRSGTSGCGRYVRRRRTCPLIHGDKGTLNRPRSYPYCPTW